MEEDKTIVAVVVVGDNLHHARPILRLHIRRVDGGTKGNGFDVVVETREFRHEVADVLPIEGFKCASGGIFKHTNRTASVDDEYPSSVHVMICFCKYTFF